MAHTSIDYYNDALDALQAGNAPEALAAIVNSLTEDPHDKETWKLYIVILTTLGRTEDAEKATAKLREMGLSGADEHLMKAAEAASAGDLARAIPHYQAALDEEPNRADIHTSLAIVLLQAGDSQGARAAAEMATELDPAEPHAHYALGRILRLAGEKEAALASLTRAVSLDPALMVAVYEQGMIFAEQGQLQQALENFERFLAAHPDDPAALQAATGLRQRLNQTL
jgi:Flp pilus assembly protein TadD